LHSRVYAKKIAHRSSKQVENDLGTVMAHYNPNISATVAEEKQKRGQTLDGNAHVYHKPVKSSQELKW